MLAMNALEWGGGRWELTRRRPAVRARASRANTLLHCGLEQSGLKHRTTRLMVRCRSQSLLAMNAVEWGGGRWENDAEETGGEARLSRASTLLHGEPGEKLGGKTPLPFLGGGNRTHV